MRNKKQFLFIPSPPTPNGRLHLGHIGGPYLTADIVRRHLNALGHEAIIISGTDSYESYVEATSAKEARDHSSVCHHYHRLIVEDLKIMQIDTCAFINPLDEVWHHNYVKWQHDVFANLAQEKALKLSSEQLPFDRHLNRYVLGCWLHGQCPICATSVTGYFCEQCGAHFRPEEITNDSQYDWRIMENYFLQLPLRADNLSKKINASSLAIYENFLKHQQHLLRVTTPMNWGVALDQQRSFFSYGLIYAYFLMCGEVAGKMFGTNQNAFAHDSDVVTVSSFGVDNVTAFLASAEGISHYCKSYKPFDYYLVNHFYHLAGSKFSTSRAHAIWAHEFADKKPIMRDLIRFFLTTIDVKNSIGNFNREDLSAFITQMIATIKGGVVHALTHLTQPKKTCSEGLTQQIAIALKEQEKYLNYADPIIHVASAQLLQWFAIGKSMKAESSDYFWWLKAFSVLSYPFMPTLSTQVWQALGYQEKPSNNHFFDLPSQKISPFTID